MIDDGELDWKVLAVQIDDPLAKEYNDISDVPESVKAGVREWFRWYKTPDDKPINEFGFNEEYLDKAKADKKSQQAAIASLKAEWDPLKVEFQSLTDIRAGIKSVSSEIKNLQSQFTQEMTKVAANAATLKKEYDLLQESIARQLSEKIDKAALGVELLMFKKNQSIQSQEITRLAEGLDAIQSQKKYCPRLPP